MVPLFASFILVTSACSNVEFSPAKQESNQKASVPLQGTQGADPAAVVPPDPVVVTPPSAPVCVPVAAITRLTKILFLVDTSGSNSVATDAITGNSCDFFNMSTCIPATDPAKKFRLGSIQNFVNKYTNKKNFQWGFITFSGVSAHDFVGKGSKLSFTASPDIMNSAINVFANQADGGDTPYASAINAATNAIANDPDHNSVLDPQYFVIMLTDGYPTDFQKTTDPVTYVSKLLAAAKQEVSLSTIFYGPQKAASSASAISLLQKMAALGVGQFANVNNPKTGINIDDVIPGKNCP